MKKSYTIVIEDADQNEELIKFLQEDGSERYNLPDNIVLMVDEDAPEEIKMAAAGAEGGNYDDYLIAIGEEDMIDKNPFGENIDETDDEDMENTEEES